MHGTNMNKVFLNWNLSPSSETHQKGNQTPQQPTGSTISVHPIICVHAATITQYRTQTQRTSTPLQQTRVFNPPNQHSFLHRQTIGNLYTESQTREFVNIIKSLNLPSHISISPNPYQPCSFNSYSIRMKAPYQFSSAPSCLVYLASIMATFRSNNTSILFWNARRTRNKRVEFLTYLSAK